MDWIIKQSWLTLATWLVFLGWAFERWWMADPNHALVALSAFGAILSPVLIERYLRVALPEGFIAGFAIFTLATIGLGELGGYYAWLPVWNWAMHAIAGFWLAIASALGARALEPLRPLTLAVFGFLGAVAIGGLWEIFEYGIDNVFDVRTQGIGVADTMHDLMSDTLGAALGAWAVWADAKGRNLGPVSSVMRAFERRNAWAYGALEGSGGPALTGSERPLPPDEACPHLPAGE